MVSSVTLEEYDHVNFLLGRTVGNEQSPLRPGAPRTFQGSLVCFIVADHEEDVLVPDEPPALMPPFRHQGQASSRWLCSLSGAPALRIPLAPSVHWHIGQGKRDRVVGVSLVLANLSADFLFSEIY